MKSKYISLLLNALIIVVIFISGCIQLGDFKNKTESSAQSNMSEASPVNHSEMILTSDFTPCSGMDTTQKNPIAYHRILLANSTDGLHFTRMNKVIDDRASVPDIMVDKEGNVRIYYVLITCKEQGEDRHDIPVVAISPDKGQTWFYKNLKIEAPSEAPHCYTPGGFPTPVDPEVLLMPDGTYRLYATCPRGTENGTPMTFVFFSNDGINFKDGKITYVPKTIALDPVVFKVGSEWWLINGNSNPAKSSDGITFIGPENEGPFSSLPQFRDPTSGKMNYYVIGDVLTLENPIRYRLYLFGDTPEEGIKSIISTDGKTWSMEQSTNEYILSVDKSSNTFEYYKLMFPTVARLKDGSYLMAYETFIPGTPYSVLSGGEQQQGGTQPSSGGKVGCGDGICDSIERNTGTCPQDCH